MYTTIYNTNYFLISVSDMEVDENETCAYTGHYRYGVSSNCDVPLPAACEIGNNLYIQ